MHSEPGHSVLLVPVPQLEPFVRERTAFYDRDFLSSDPSFTHAHVTVLGPFVPSLDEESASMIAAMAADTEPFDFLLERLDTFPDGIIHLRPQPDAPFRELTGRFAEAFPDFPPYGGAFPDPTPHLTLDLAGGDVSEASTRALLGDLVPATCRARRLDLAWYEAGGCRVVARWPLGRRPQALKFD